MKKTTIKIFTLLLTILFPIMGQENKEISSQAWAEDLDQLTQLIKTKHPNPFKNISESDFNEKVKDVREIIPIASDKKIVTELMKLIGFLNDGHSGIITDDSEITAFNEWFPIRYYKFSDGWYIIKTDENQHKLKYYKVKKVGKYLIDEVIEKVYPIISADNDFGKIDMMPFYLSNGNYLAELEIIENANRLVLIVENNGKEETLRFHSQKLNLDSRWLKNPIDPPVRGMEDVKNEQLQGLKSIQKLHETSFWYDHDKTQKLLYFQFNSVTNNEEESLLNFTSDLLEYAEENVGGIQSFVIDLRYNEGGNGHLLLPFIHEFIKHEKLFGTIDLYAIIGRRTFSAGVIAVSELNRHTNCTFVGEPMGASLNFFSDGIYYRLKNSNLLVYLSSLYFQLAIPANNDSCFYPDVPIETSSFQMSHNIDPQLDVINSGLARSLFKVCISEGVEAAVNHYKKQRQRFMKYNWWKPKSEMEINNYGYQLVDEKKYREALKIFELNSKLFPDSWNCWDSLGEQYLRMGDQNGSIECYEKSYSLNNKNVRAKEIVEKLLLQNFLKNLRFTF